MKKKWFLFCALGVMSLFATAQQNYPQWALNLVNLNTDIIDSVQMYPHQEESDYTSYIIYYHRPLTYKNPQGENFSMRALLSVRDDMDATHAVNHIYITGYQIGKEYIKNPTDDLDNGDETDATEIGMRYKANYIMLEHRYFTGSAPDNCWTRLDYCTSEEAAEDFHAIINAMKKVLLGKWVISGSSKGGITTALQQMYHPEDADIFVPYSAPFFDTYRDTVMQHYWLNNGWSQSLRDYMMAFRRAAADTSQYPAIYNVYYFDNGYGHESPAGQDSLWAMYLCRVADFGFLAHAYLDTATIYRFLAQNDTILQTIWGNTYYNDTAIAYMIAHDSITLRWMGPWLDTLRKYSHLQQCPPRRRMYHRPNMPVGITEKEWFDGDSSGHAYEYQARRELGYYDLRFTEIMTDPVKAAALNAKLDQYNGHGAILYPWGNAFTFSPDIYNRVTAATQQATKPIIFIYGLDDTWTGAAMKDRYINGTNVRKFIFPNQNHNVAYSSRTDESMTNDILAMLDAVLGPPVGIESVAAQTGGTKAVKVIENGQLYIIRNNVKYDLTGKICK